MCRLSLKFSTPIAREIVRITLSVCYVQCSMKCACVRSLFPIIWMESHFMQQFIGNRFTMKMVRFQFTVSFHFIYNRLPYKSSSDCLFSNVGMSIIFGANNNEGNGKGGARQRVRKETRHQTKLKSMASITVISDWTLDCIDAAWLSSLGIAHREMDGRRTNDMF